MGRLNKRQQREQEELLSLGAPDSTPASDPVNEVSEPESSDGIAQQHQTSGFAALKHDDIQSEKSDTEEQPTSVKSKSKKNKKKKSGRSAATESSAATPQPKVKGKNKSKKDDFDAALEELAARAGLAPGDTKSKESVQSKATATEMRLLSAEPKYLDGDAELRRFFGAKVVNNAKEPTKRTHTGLRSVLTKPPQGWAGLRLNNGLSMRPLSPEELDRITCKVDGERWWTFEHSSSYKKTQLEFLEHVATGDPNGLGVLLQRNPWHIDTLLQLSEVFRHQEDYSHATDLVDRALFSFERSCSASFNLLSGTHRLDFDRIENRPFFLALHRQILQLERRGCMRTALEFAKVLLSLEPWTDPHGALLHIDAVAPKCGMDDWFLQLWDAEEDYTHEAHQNRIDIRCLPGMSYARAACLRNIEINCGDKNHEKSTEALKQAVLNFPSVVPVLADKAGISLTADVRGHPFMRIETGWMDSDPANAAIHFLSHLYAQRSASTWKQPNFASWMQETVTAILPQLKGGGRALRDRALQHFTMGPTMAMCRHVVVCEMRSLLGFFSPAFLSTEMHAYDPVPPQASITEYDEAYFGPLSGMSQQNPRRSAQTQAGFGVPGDAALAQQMIQQLLLADARGENRGHGALPGAFMDDVNPIDEVNPSDDEADIPPQAPGVLQRFWQGLFGQSATPQNDSESDVD